MERLGPPAVQLAPGATPSRAAEYVRMSTEHQQYSTENQSDVMRKYAERRGMAIVRTYADAGKSGLRIDGRDALKQLIHDVESGQADFNAILVYDVSRWGRFQDVDASGASWRLSADMWLVCGLAFPIESPPTVGREHWIIAAFQQRMTVDPPNTEHELLTIAASIAAEHPSAPQIDDAIGRALVTLPNGVGDLHAIRRWIEWMVGHAAEGVADVGMLRRAILEDLRWILPRIQYRGRTITMERFERWTEQFPDEVRPAAIHMIREIADRYHIDNRRYFDALDDLIGRSGFPGSTRLRSASGSTSAGVHRELPMTSRTKDAGTR